MRRQTNHDPYKLVGTMLGDYRVQELVGIGGVGVVYRADCLGNGRSVALKILKPDVAIRNPAMVQSFLEEGAKNIDLRHPYIANTTRADVLATGLAFLEMEWIEGRTLDDEMKECGAISLERVASVLEQLCEALEYVHTQGIVHRDLKPSNIMLATDHNGVEVVKVMDFGIVKEISSAVSDNSRVMEAPHYSSPEQLVVSSCISPASDIYSVGVIAYEMITGKLPFDSNSIEELVRQHLTATLPSLRQLSPKIPASVEEVVHKALAKEPKWRYTRIEEFARAFKHAASSGATTPPLQCTDVRVDAEVERIAALTPEEVRADLRQMNIEPIKELPAYLRQLLAKPVVRPAEVIENNSPTQMRIGNNNSAIRTSANRIAIFDTTLCSGEQAPGCSMNLSEKIRLARKLQALGVDIIEAGFPIASEGDFAAVKAVAAECREVTVAALCRATELDILRAWEAVGGAARPRLHTFVATSDIHLEHKLKKSRAEVLQMTRDAVRLARSFTDDVEFSAEDATRSDLNYLCEVFAVAVGEGARTLNVPDTVGYTTPTEFREIVSAVCERVVGDKDVIISVHCHNDLGLAVANSLAALDAGARQVSCTINGIGERAGNAALEEVVMALHVRADRLPYACGIRTEEIYPTSQLLTEIIGFGVQPNKAVVGRNAFAHEAGIHQHGVLSNPLCYEIMTPESVGVPSNNIVLGKHSGRHALSRRFNELGFTLSPPELEDAYHRFTKLADRKKNIYDQDLLSLLPADVRTAEVHDKNLAQATPTLAMLEFIRQG